jgi:iron complex transport system permease protein
LLRNPLASPDVVGITSAPASRPVGGMVFLQVGGIAISVLALGGAVGAALQMYVLA